MEKFLEEKNKMIMFSFLNLLIIYTNATITEFKFMEIDFKLKDEYSIISFSSIIFIIFLYYVLQMFFQYTILIRTAEYKKLILEEKRESIILNNLPSYIGWLVELSNFFISFKFLNYYLPLLLINLTIYFKFFTNLDILIFNLGIQILIFIVFYFEFKDIENKTLGPIISYIKLIEIKTDDLNLAIEKIKKNSIYLEEKDKIILDLAHKTVKKRTSELTIQKDDILLEIENLQNKYKIK
jgi:hypothetical protein